MSETPESERTGRYRRSVALRERAVGAIPEATSSNVRGVSSYAPAPLVYMAEGDGAILRDVDGNEYVDCLCGVSSIISGHAPAFQREAVAAQLERGSYFATAYEGEIETAELLTDVVPSADLAKFISTGTEAAMSAIRLARAYTGRERICKFEGMYHGHTDYMLLNVHPPAGALGTRRAAETVPAVAGIPDGTRESIDTLPWNDLALLESYLERYGDEVAAVITEGVLSNGGMLHPDDGYVEGLRELTREHDVLLILDEVVTGFRVGLGGAEAHFGIEPDLSIWGKAMANGYPCAAVTGRAEVMEFIGGGADRGDFMGTFSGNPLVVAAANANLTHLRETVGEAGYTAMHERGQRLADAIEEAGRDAGLDVFVPEFLGYSHVFFHDGETDPRTWTDWRDVEAHADEAAYGRFAEAMIDEGVFFVPRDYARFNLTHAHTDEHVDRAVAAATAAVERVSA